MKIRPATTDDCHLIYEWSMDPVTRANGTRGDWHSLEDHTRWYAERLADPNTLIYIAEDKKWGPVGVIRYQRVRSGEPMWTGGPLARDDGPAEVSIIVAPGHRGRRFGRHILNLALPPKGWTHRIRALILPHNTASIRAFEYAGYDRAGEETRMGKDHLVYERAP